MQAQPATRPSAILEVRKLILLGLCIVVYVTVNVAVGVTVWFRFLSNTFIFNWY